METIQNDVSALLSAGAAAVPYQTVREGIPFAVLPEGYEAKSLESLLELPARKRGKVVTSDSASFIAYTKKHSTEDGSVIYAAIESEKSKCALVAVLDDHESSAPQWQEHRCDYAPKLSVEYARWTARNTIKMSQSDFATWLEDNLPDIATVPGMPTGAEILAMALGFEANSDKRLRSKVNLQSGGFTFEFVDKENDNTRATMRVFERFTIGVPVFDGSASAYPMEARLKYREKDGVVTFWYELIRPDRVFKTAVTEEVETIKRETGLMLIYGLPA